MATATATTYRVKIRRESDFRHSGDCWVARDGNGDWRSYCDGQFADNPLDAAIGMFHADEIKRIVIDGDRQSATVTIFG